MKPLSSSAHHGALFTEKIPFFKDRVIFIRSLIVFLHAYRNRFTSAAFQIPLRPKLAEGTSNQKSTLGNCLDTSEDDEEKQKQKSTLPKCTDISEEVEETLKLFTWKDEYPDFAVICKNRRFLVHKRILEDNSIYFKRMFHFNGIETTKKEVKLYDVDPSLIEHVLDFMYTGHYTLPGGTTIPTTGWCNHMSAAVRDGPPKSAQIFKRRCVCSGKITCPSHLFPHIGMYAMADYFDMPFMRGYAQQGARDVLHVHWGDEDLDLVDALEEAFTSTPDEDRGIRAALIHILKEHPGLWVDEGEVHDWLDDHPEVKKCLSYTSNSFDTPSFW